MSDPDFRDFFKGSNRAKKFNDELKKKKKQQQQGHMNHITPFSPATMPPTVVWRDPVPPIDVVKKNSYLEWEWMGNTFRPYYAGNLWLNCDASHVYKAFLNRDTYEITTVEPLDVKIDADGKQYVENWVNKVFTKVYLDDALRTCFHTGLPPVKVSNPIHQKVSQPNPPQQVMLNRTLYPLDGDDYAFDNIEKFFVSKKNGKAAGLSVDWGKKIHNPDKAKRYNVFSRKDGTLAVNVKQPDGTYKNNIDLATVVCRTFYGEPPINSMVVKFKDGNVSNCDADNLYWDMP